MVENKSPDHTFQYRNLGQVMHQRAVVFDISDPTITKEFNLTGTSQQPNKSLECYTVETEHQGETFTAVYAHDLNDPYSRQHHVEGIKRVVRKLATAVRDATNNGCAVHPQ